MIAIMMIIMIMIIMIMIIKLIMIIMIEDFRKPFGNVLRWFSGISMYVCMYVCMYVRSHLAQVRHSLLTCGLCGVGRA